MRARLFPLFAVASTVGCATLPPPSLLPNGQAAIDRMRESQTCATGVHASATIDSFGREGRLRGELLLYAVRPTLLRLDIVSPFGVALETLTSDGRDFGLADLRNRQVLRGPASTCNIARLTSVPIPGHALVGLMRGEAPVLKHAPEGATVSWNSSGYYTLKIRSTRDAEEEIQLVPRPADWARPWNEQRLRVRDVRVRQRGFELYHVELRDHAGATTAPPMIDKEGIDPPIPPSGPECDADVARAIHIEVPARGADLRIRYQKAEWNPPLPAGVFTQPTSPGYAEFQADCAEDEPLLAPAKAP